MNEVLNFFPYQKEGADWLTRTRHALLADEMGLGKSAQVILACDRLDLSRVLIICPAVARLNWEKEFKTWGRTPRNFSVLLRFDDIPLHSKQVICSFEYATQFPERLQGPWDVIVIDETHFLKSIEAKRSKRILGRYKETQMGPWKYGLVHKAQRVWALSGTPAPNHAGELWPLLYTFGVSNLSYEHFVERYCTSRRTGYGLQILGTKRTSIPELKAMLAKVMLRRRKSEVLKDLPPILFSDLVVEPGKIDESFFEESKLKHERELLDQVLKMKDPMGALMALANSVSTLRRYTGLQKVEPVCDLVSGELASQMYEKVIIFGIHKAVLQGIQTRLKDFKPVLVNGETPPEKKQKYQDQFQNDKKTKIFLGNIISAGTNLTLTSANQVIVVEADWVPGNNAQAVMRAHRIGQKNNVTARFVSIANPTEERLTQVLRRKTDELAELF